MTDRFLSLLEQHHELALEFKKLSREFHEQIKQMQEYNRHATRVVDESRNIVASQLFILNS